MVTSAELSEKTPQVERDADAEVLDWTVIGNDELLAGGFVSFRDHHVMIKIYTDKGRDEHGRVDITYDNGVAIKGIRGRTVLPDGKVLLLQNKDIYDRMVVQHGGARKSAKSFVLPGVVPGAVIEYAWHESHQTYYLADGLEFQRDIPVRHVAYKIKPDPSLHVFQLTTSAFNGATSTFRPDDAGYYVAEQTSVPGFREEPDMPPDAQVKPWLLVYYQDLDEKVGTEYWDDLAKKRFHDLDSYFQPDDDIKQKAVQLAGGTKDTAQALSRLYEFCRTQIHDIDEDAADTTVADESRPKPSKSCAETLRRRKGNRVDIDDLFVSLARGLGYDARMTMAGDRSSIFFRPRMTNSAFLRYRMPAVNVGGAWDFFDPADRYLPFGMLPWAQEGLPALLPDSKKAVFVTPPLSSEWASMETRTGTMRLAPDGALDGDAILSWTGHQAVREKEWNDDAAPDSREKRIRDHMKILLAGATISDVRIEHAADLVDSVVCRFHVHAPSFAQVAGRRLLLRPALFEHDVAPRFAASERRHDIYFSYGWSEYDSVRIELPEGYELDQAEVPESFKLGDFGSYTVDLAVTKEHPTLIYRRAFEVHDILLPRDEYAAIKQAFDTVHERDQHTIALRPMATAAH